MMAAGMGLAVLLCMLRWVLHRRAIRQQLRHLQGQAVGVPRKASRGIVLLSARFRSRARTASDNSRSARSDKSAGSAAYSSTSAPAACQPGSPGCPGAPGKPADELSQAEAGGLPWGLAPAAAAELAAGAAAGTAGIAGTLQDLPSEAELRAALHCLERVLAARAATPAAVC